jgi:NAD(P)-dependent dehydrogenase (short-subunit alcohol dehydrogenase family)
VDWAGPRVKHSLALVLGSWWLMCRTTTASRRPPGAASSVPRRCSCTATWRRSRRWRRWCRKRSPDSVASTAHVADLPADAFCRTIEVNLTGVYRCVHHEARVMRAQQRGAIVNCASILGVVGFGGAAAYTAAKHGVVGLTKAAAIDLAKEGVRVNAICPGFIDTPMLEQAGMTTDAVVRASVEALHPMGRLGQSHEIADPVLWLCSDKATFVTGQALMVDGGYVAQ